MINYISGEAVEIRGVIYRENLVVDSSGKIFSWNKNHKGIQEEDINLFLEKKPEIMIIGKKEEVKITDSIMDGETFFVIDEIKEAVISFNFFLQSGKKVLGVFNLKS